MTSNIGSQIIQDSFEEMNDLNADEIISQTKVKVYELLKKTIRPEFLNRIDEVLMFQPLNRDEVKEIVKIQFNKLQEMLAKNDITITATDDAIDWLSQLGFDPQFGARPLKRVMQKKVLNELSKQILSAQINKEDIIELNINKNKDFVFKNIAKEVVI